MHPTRGEIKPTRTTLLCITTEERSHLAALQWLPYLAVSVAVTAFMAWLIR